MEVRVKMVGFPGLSRLLGRQETTVRLDGKTLGDLLKHLVKEHGEGVAKALLDEDGGLDPSVQVIRNGEQWLGGKDLSAELHEGDSIVFLLLLAGG